MENNRFLRAFKEEHKVILNELLELRKVVNNRDNEAAAKLVEDLDRIMGPHFKVEEEALYPMLREYFGDENVEKLIEEHDIATSAMIEFKNNIGNKGYLEEHARDTLKHLQGFFMHVTSCDGLSIIIDRFSDEQKQELETRLDEVWENPEPLTSWRTASGH